MDREGSGRVNWESGFSLQLLVQQSFLPAQHFYGYTAFLGQNWYYMQIPQVTCISDINSGCPKGDRELNGNGRNFPTKTLAGMLFWNIDWVEISPVM